MKTIRIKSILKSFLLLYIVIISVNLTGEVFYKISGKVVHDGKGISGIKLDIFQYNSENSFKGKYALNTRTFSDNNGDFHFYVKSGLYKIRFGRFAQKGFVANSNYKIIQIEKKNVSNIIFFLIKECIISGVVKFKDGIPLNGGEVEYENNNGSWSGEININGEYRISGIKNGENGNLYFTPNGVLQKDVFDIVLNQEGMELKNIDLILPKNKSIIGTVVDKIDKSQIKKFTIFLLNLSNYEQIIYEGNNITNEFTFYNLKSGNYTISCDMVIIKNGDNVIIYKRKESIIYLKENETKAIVIELERESEERVKEIIGAKNDN